MSTRYVMRNADRMTDKDPIVHFSPVRPRLIVADPVSHFRTAFEIYFPISTVNDVKKTKALYVLFVFYFTIMTIQLVFMQQLWKLNRSNL